MLRKKGRKQEINGPVTLKINGGVRSILQSEKSMCDKKMPIAKM